MLAITLGDPKSINIRAVLHLLSEIPEDIVVLLIGSWQVWKSQNESMASIAIKGESLSSTPRITLLNSADEIKSKKMGTYFYDPTAQNTDDIYSESFRGMAAFKSLMAVKEVTDIAESAHLPLAVLTCPIDKKVTTAAGFEFPGQTEFFGSIWQGESIMILAGPKLRVGLVTNHLALSEVEGQITSELVLQKYKTFEDSLRILLDKKEIRIAVCGLNPHLSDGGMFGDTEEKILFPAENILKSQGHNPKLAPADTAFFFSIQGKYDGVLAMYHDQGLGPLKTIHFDDAINITGGLQHVRVSPDHGPAGDKMYSDEISLRSFRMALNHCINYLKKG